MPTNDQDLRALTCGKCGHTVPRRKLLRRGMCSTCYAKWLGERTGKLRRSVLERFWTKVEKTPESGCWQWMGTGTPKGYGQFGHHRHDLRPPLCL